MGHALSPVTQDDVGKIVEAQPFELPKSGRNILWALIFVGGVCFFAGITGHHPKHAWVSFHVNFTYWFLLSAAATCFSAVFHICNAQWARPIRRLFEAGSMFFLWSFIPMVILYFGRHYLFVWVHEAVPGKEAWLSSPFVYIRDVVGMMVLAFVGTKVVELSVRRDLAAVRGGLTGLPEDSVSRWNDESLDAFVRGSDSDAKNEIKRTNLRMSRFSPLVIVIYAVVVTFFAFDQIMSVDPVWFSTLFGAHLFMSAGYLALAWVAIGIGFVRLLHPLYRQKIERRTLHDLGKLLFGFGIFWAYLFWSHYLTIWYSNLPEEAGWVLIRWRHQPWHNFSWLILGLCFFVPFLLGLSRDVKQIPILLFATGAIVAFGIWLQQYVLFAPSLYPTQIPLNFLDVGITLGFLGAFLLSAAHFLSRVPLMPFGDFYCPPVGE